MERREPSTDERRSRPPRGRKPTLADVARLAGVSKSTVSRALNDSPLIGAETKERIRTIARQHGFQMNVPARRLSLQQSSAVALVLQEKHAEPQGEEPEPDVFMLEIMSGVSRALSANGYDLIVTHVRHGDVDWISRYLDARRADGFVVLSASCSPRQLRALREVEAPFVAWGAPPGPHPYCTVSGDSVTGGRIATEHLLRTGRRRIAFVGGSTWAHEVGDRMRGYEIAHERAGLPVDPALVVNAGWKAPEGAAAMAELLERAPDLDAVFANSDVLALAAIDVLRERGRRVPDDVAVVGYDDIALARLANPPLTTVRQDGPLAGRLLAESLLQHLRTGAITNVSIPAELVVRASA